jgi:hypothetical protein
MTLPSSVLSSWVPGSMHDLKGIKVPALGSDAYYDRHPFCVATTQL